VKRKKSAIDVILALETATRQCSVALGTLDGVMARREARGEGYVHAERLHLLVAEVLEEASCTWSDITEIRVGRGPGSYTGLRIGVSAAKGYAYARGIALTSANTLDVLVGMALAELEVAPQDCIAPVVDARRMEVYTQVSNATGQVIQSPWAEIIESNSWSDYRSEGQTLWVVGDAAAKIQPLHWNCGKVTAVEMWPSAAALLLLPPQLVQQEDVFSFEPYYLKDFVAVKPKGL
jgi:tRNA threonylcarbamoyladenosine biosynthesis protein TsaB